MDRLDVIKSIVELGIVAGFAYGVYQAFIAAL